MTRDVTNAVQRIRNTYGGSDNTNPRNLSANKSINYASGNTFINANSLRVTVAPSSFTLTGEVGLFGVENDFIKIDLNILNTGGGGASIPDNDGYSSASFIQEPETSDYADAAVDYTLDTTVVNSYNAAALSNTLANYYLPTVDIKLINNGTGNIYMDSHVDVSLYTEDRRPLAFDNAFVSAQGCFFIGIHARKSRRLPYNVSVTLGERYVSLLDLNANERDKVLTTLGGSY